jgi:hypothetical protein
MFKPNRAICKGCQSSQLIVVKAGYCKRCNEEHKRLKKGLSKFVAPIAKMSDKRQKENALYLILRKKYLQHHPVCEFQIENICTHEATTIHHPAGRTGDLFLDDTLFKSGCIPCHQWVELHPKEAKVLGYSLNRLSKT